MYFLSLLLFSISLILLVLSYYQIQPLIWTPKIQFPALQTTPTVAVENIRGGITPNPVNTQTDLKSLLQTVSQINSQQLDTQLKSIQNEAAAFIH